MKSFKKLLPALLTVMVIAMSLLLVSCGDDACNHKWSDWENTGVTFCDGNEQVRTCSKCGEKEMRSSQTGDYSLHDFTDWTDTKVMTCTEDGLRTRSCKKCPLVENETVAKTGHTDTLVCLNCGMPMVTAPDDINLDDFKTYALKITDFKMSVSDDAHIEENADTTMLDLFEAYVTLDENNDLYGYGYGKIKIDAIETDVENEFEITVYFYDGYAYVCSDGANNVESTQYKKNYVRYALTTADANEITAAIDEYNETIEKVAEWLESYDFSKFTGIDLGEYPENVRYIIADTINDMFVKTTNDDGTVLYTLSPDEMYHLIDVICDETISSHVDAILGEGTFKKLSDLVGSDEFYELSVSDALNYIEVDLGINLEELFGDLDALAVIILNKEDATFEEFLSEIGAIPLSDDFDIYEFITDESLSNQTVMDAIINFTIGDLGEASEEEINELKANIKDSISKQFTEIGSSTLFKLNSNPEMSEEEFNSYVEEQRDYARERIERAFDYFDFSVCLGNNNSFEYAAIKLTIEDTTIDVKITDKVSISYAIESSSHGNIKAEIIPGQTIEINEEKANALTVPFDYDYEVTLDDIISYLELNKRYNEFFVINNGSLYICEITSYNYVTIEDDSENYNYTVWVRFSKIKNCTMLSVVEKCGGGYIYSAKYEADETQKTIQFNNIVAPVTVTHAMLLDALKLDEYDFDSVDFGRDTQKFVYFTLEDGKFTPFTGDFDNYGHNYVLNEELSIPYGDECNSIGYDYYTCSECGDSYKYYTSNSHDLVQHYTYENGIYTGKNICTDCGEVFDTFIWTIKIETELEKEYYESNTYAGFSVTIDEETAGNYTVYSEDNENYSADTYLTVYVVNGDELEAIATADYGGFGGHFSLDITLESGKTYVFAPQKYGTSKFYDSRNIVVYLALDEVE